jgi:hypothetical protein
MTGLAEACGKVNPFGDGVSDDVLRKIILCP